MAAIHRALNSSALRLSAFDGTPKAKGPPMNFARIETSREASR